MMMDVAGGVIIALAVGAGFAAGIYSLTNNQNGVGALYLTASVGTGLWIVPS